MIQLKTPEEIKTMDRANQILHYILNAIEPYVKPGENTQVFDDIASKQCKLYGVEPAFKGYKGFPKSICISINEEVVHGIPSINKIIKEGDVVSLDFGLVYQGLFADAAKTIIVGQASEDRVKLVENTKAALMAGIEQMKIGNRLHDISAAIETIAKANNYGNVRDFIGHGIGRELHESPQVPNYVEPKIPNIRLEEGLVLAIEPMFCLGGSEVEVVSDKWTVLTKDKSVACHWELSVAIVDGKPFILGQK